MTRRRNSAQPVIKETFTLYTPESVEAGDAAESGWIDEEGVDMTPDEYDVEEGVTAVDKAVKHLRSEGVSEQSSSSFHKGAWYCSMHEPDFRTGEQEERCFHLHGFSTEEEHSIFQQMTARRRSNPRSQRLRRAATRDVTIPVCEACRDAIHFAGEPDFPWHPAAAGEVCGVADHDHDHDHDTSAADAARAVAADAFAARAAARAAALDAFRDARHDVSRAYAAFDVFDAAGGRRMNPRSQRLRRPPAAASSKKWYVVDDTTKKILFVGSEQDAESVLTKELNYGSDAFLMENIDEEFKEDQWTVFADTVDP